MLKNTVSFYYIASLFTLIFLSGCSLQKKEEPSGFYYRIQKGDSLESIAHACEISQWEIRQQNKNIKSYRPGEVIFIPRFNSNLKDLLRPRRSYVHRYEPEVKKFEYQPQYQYERKPSETFKYGSLDIYNRSYWGAGPIKASNINIMNGIQKITVHHTALLPVFKNKSDADVVKHIYQYHHHQKGWADIGYHYLIGRDGLIYQGRLDKYQGAHAGAGNNRHNLGIALIGDFNQQNPSPLQLASLESLIRESIRKHNINPNNIFGHKDLKATECPGDYLYRELQNLKRRLSPNLFSYLSN